MADIAALGLKIEQDGVAEATRALNDMSAAAGKAEAATAKLSRARAAGAQTEAKATSATTAATQAGAKAAEAAAAAQKAAAAQAQNVAARVGGIAASLASKSPMLAMATQGGQAAQALNMVEESFGGVEEAMLRAGARFGPWGTAATVALGVTIGATVRYQRELEKLAASMNGLGRASGVTLERLTKISAESASAAGVGRFSAMRAMADFTGAGIGAGVSSGLLGVTKDFSRITGQSFGAGAKDLAGIFADPVKGADELQKRLGAVSAGTRELIRAMSDSGNTTGAQSLLLRTLANDMKGAEDRTWFFVKAWNVVKTALENGGGAIGAATDRLINGPGLEDQIATLEKRRRAAESNQRGGRLNKYFYSGYEKELQSLLVENTEAQDRARARASIQAARKSSTSAQATVFETMGDAREITRLTEKLKELRDQMSTPAGMNQMAVSFEDATKAANAYEAAIKSLATGGTVAERQRAIEIASITARTDAQRGAVARMQAELEMRGRLIGEVERTARAVQAETVVMMQAAEAAKDRVRSSQDSAAVAGLSGYRRTQAEINQRWNRQNELNAGNGAALGANERARALELYAARMENIVRPMREANDALDEQGRLLAVQARMFGASTGAVTAEVEFQKLLTQAKRDGLDQDKQYVALLRARADALGRVTQATEDLSKAHQKTIAGMDSVRSETRSAFGGLFSDLRNGKNPGQGLLDSMTRIMDRVIEARVTAPLVESLLGKEGKPGGGLFGDMVSGWLGGGKDLQTATINAATVNVNGGNLAGLGGTIPKAANDNAGIPTFARMENSGLSGYSAPRGTQGLNPDFQQRLGAFFAEFPGLSITSGFRTYAQQAALYAQKPGWAAPPGRSNHERGMAADIGLGGGWTWDDVHSRAAEFGIRFPLKDRAVRPEPWHAEPIKDWQSKGADVPLPPRVTRDLDALSNAAKRAGEATNGLGDGVSTVTKSLANGDASLATAGAKMGQATTQFTAAGDGIFSAILGGIGQVGNSFVSGLGTVLQTILQAMSSSGGGGLGGFGGFLSSIMGAFGGGTAGTLTYAKGGAFYGGNVVPFAGGGVVSSPTAFGMSRGRVGLMGEAGPEAIMPLARGPDGKLGVRSNGGGGDAGLSAAIARLSESIGSSGPQVVIENNTRAKVTTEEEQSPGGGRRMRARLDEATADAVGRSNSRTMAAMKAAQAVGRR